MKTNLPPKNLESLKNKLVMLNLVIIIIINKNYNNKKPKIINSNFLSNNFKETLFS